MDSARDSCSQQQQQQQSPDKGDANEDEGRPSSGAAEKGDELTAATIPPLKLLDPAALGKSEDNGGGSENNGFFSEAPPPSPEKSARQSGRQHSRRRRRHHRGLDGCEVPGAEELGQRSGLELEVEALLDNATGWRKRPQARIRTPVRRAVLAYSAGHGGGGGGGLRRRQQVMCDLSAKVRELDVTELSMSIACSVQHKQQQHHEQHPYHSVHSVGAGGLSSSHGAAPPPRHLLQSRGGHSSLGPLRREVATAATTKSSKTTGGSLRRAKTSLFLASYAPELDGAWATTTEGSVTKADLLRLQSINGEVQRSLYTERTPCLRRLLHSGEEPTSSRRAGAAGEFVVSAGAFRVHAAKRKIAAAAAAAAEAASGGAAAGVGNNSKMK